MRLLALVLALLAGCGSGGATAVDPLVGDWQLAQGSCVYGPNFNADATYALILVCALDTGATGIEVEAGSYSATADQITTVPTKASCAGRTTQTVAYAIADNGNRLVITDDVGILSFIRQGPSTGGQGGSATFGCFEMGKFTPRPVTPL